MALIDMSMWHVAANQWGSSSRTVSGVYIGAFITPDYPKEGDQLRMPDGSGGKGSILNLTTRLVTLGSNFQLLRIKMGGLSVTAQGGGSIFRMESGGVPHWTIRDAISNNWELLDKNGTIQATFPNPLTGTGTLDKIKILWTNSVTGTFQMWVNGSSVVSVSGTAFDRTSSSNSAIKFFGTFNASAPRVLTIGTYLMDTAVSDNGTDDWYVPKYIASATGDGDTKADGTGSAEAFDVNSWAEITDRDGGTKGGYTGTNGANGSGAYTNKSGQGGPSGDSEILPAWNLRGTSWGIYISGTFATPTVYYGKWDGSSTVTATADGGASGQAHYFAPDGTSPSPSKTDTGFTGFKHQSGTGDKQLIESAVFVAIDVVPATGNPWYQYAQQAGAAQ